MSSKFVPEGSAAVGIATAITERMAISDEIWSLKTVKKESMSPLEKKR